MASNNSSSIEYLGFFLLSFFIHLSCSDSYFFPMEGGSGNSNFFGSSTILGSSTFLTSSTFFYSTGAGAGVGAGAGAGVGAGYGAGAWA